MRLVQRMFFEIYASSFIIQFMDALLTGVLFFSFFYMLFTFFKIFYLYAIAFSLLFFMVSFIKKLRKNKILEIERRYPDLKERLRTSKDYEQKENLVVLALHTEVLNAIKEVDINAFLNIKKLSIKVVGISACLFMILFLSSLDFDFFDITSQVVLGAAPVLTKIQSTIGRNKIHVQDSPDLMDEGRIAGLGDENLNLTLDVFSTDVDVGDIEPPEVNDYDGAFPDEMGASAEEQYYERISDEHRDVIKDYFKKISR